MKKILFIIILFPQVCFSQNRYGDIIDIMGKRSSNDTLWNNITNYYKLDCTPVDTVHGANDTLVNAPGYTTGIINQSININGINQYISIPNNSWDYMPISCSVWIKTPSTLGTFIIPLSNISSSSTAGWEFEIYTNILSLVNFKTSGYEQLQYTYSFSGNTWYNIGFSIATSGIATIYLNGTKVGSVAFTPVSYSGTETPKIGLIRYISTNYSGACYVDEIALFNVVKSDSWFTKIYNSGIGIQYPN